MAETKFRNINEPDDPERGATTTEELNRYLHQKHGCWFAKFTGRYSLQSSREPDRGEILARHVSFDEMLTIALARPTE